MKSDSARPPCDKCGAVADIVIGKDAGLRVAGCNAHHGWAQRRYLRNVSRAQSTRVRDEGAGNESTAPSGHDQLSPS